MPESIDHRACGRVRFALKDVSPRLIEDQTRDIYRPTFRDVATGATHLLVIAESHATTKPPTTPAGPKTNPDGTPAPPTTIDAVLDTLAASLGGSRDGDSVGFVAELPNDDGTTDRRAYTVTVEAAKDDGHADEAHPANVASVPAPAVAPAPHAGPMAAQEAHGGSPA